MTATVAGLVVAVLAVSAAWRWRPPPRRLARAVPSSSSSRPPRSVRARPLQRARRWAVLAAGGVLALAVWPPALVIVVAWEPARRHLAQRRARHRHRAQVAAALPDALDVVVLAIGAGQTVALAVGTAAQLAPAPIDAAFAEVNRRQSRGERLADALGSLVDRLGEPVRPLQSALVSSERYGIALGPTLDQLALDARRERRRLADVRARKLPVHLSFPLVGCILPAFGLLTLAPLLAGALGSLGL